MPPRAPLADAMRSGGGPVAGRLVVEPSGARLVDASGEAALQSFTGDATDGDWVTGRLERDGDVFALHDVVVLSPSRGASPDPALHGKLPALRKRAEIVAAVRAFFRDRGFLEVETPARVVCPGLEPHLRAFPSGADRWLITSPELHLKRMLAAGAEKVVELARAFRDDESGPWHGPEFTMLEWYRAFEDLDAIRRDCEELVATCASVPGIGAALGTRDLARPFERVTVRDALASRTGLDLADLHERDTFARAVEERGHPVAAGDDWDNVFFRIWIAEVEPHLGRDRPTFVEDYPASQAALATTRREPWGEVANRFELYVAGIELANAFHELTDPDEQRRRHEADREARRRAGAPVYPLDEKFLAALESGMPPASGIALGLDRLIALLLGASSLDEVSPF